MTSKFTIRSSHQAFTDKQKSLFDILENAEKSSLHQQERSQQKQDDPSSNVENNETISRRRDRNESSGRGGRYGKNSCMKQYKSHESIFKRPELPMARCLQRQQIVPGFKKNPSLWTKYTLADVKDEDMSDRSNTLTAMSFLKSIERNEDEMETKLQTVPEMIHFKKSAILKRKHASSEKFVNDVQECSYRNSKLIMPEYVVGQPRKNNLLKECQQRSSVNCESSKVQIKLDHLNDDEVDNANV